MRRSNWCGIGSGAEHRMTERNDERGAMNEEWGRWQFIIHRSSFIVAAALLIATSAIGQTNPYTSITPIPLGDTYLSLPSSHIAGNGSWEVRFTHRFNQSLDQGSFSDRVHSLWGLDSNADVGIGLSYAIRPDLQFSFYRSNALDDIELGAKYVVIQQASAVPFSIALRGGGDIRTEAGVGDRTSLSAP